VNERIKELWNKAGGDYWDSNQMGSYYHINNPEKFAELIVKECCEVVRYIDAVEIKKHFGVE
jgi:hypothetical protein